MNIPVNMLTAFDPQKEIWRTCDFMFRFFNKNHFEKAVLGISGGLDSAVVCALATKVLGAKNVFGYALPDAVQEDLADSYAVAEKFKINIETFDIHDAVEALIETVKVGDVDYKQKTGKMRLGNLKARVRMATLFDRSQKHKALVLGTGNKTELKLGYFTMYGDGACAIEPIGHLLKTQVRYIAKELGVPEQIITKAPTAGLWAGQTDEQELGATYADIDNALFWLEQYENGRVEMINVLRNVELTLLKMVMERVEANKFKLLTPAQITEPL